MNKGTLSGVVKRSPRPWVYVSLLCQGPSSYYVSAGVDATAYASGADQAVTLTSDCAGQADSMIPTDGSVRALTVLMIGKNSVAGASKLYVYHGIRGNTMTPGPTVMELGFGQIGSGSRYCSAIAVVQTTGTHNTQFWWSMTNTPATGTATVYLRVLGYWVESEEMP